MRTRALCLLLVATLFSSSPAAAQDAPTPSDHLGRELGGDFTLADWNEVSSYYQKLGDALDTVQTSKVGETTEGRDFLISVVSSAENLANLEQIKADAKALADPRGKSDEELKELIGRAKPIIFVSCQMHSTETAGSQFSMKLLQTLATSDDPLWKTTRDEAVVVIFTTNPDGVDHVTQWYRQHVGTPFEGSGLTKLYQYYTGHDNNRDWFMLTQNETQIVSRLLYKEWFPTIYWDVHQQGSTGERMFVPPYRDPLSPNLDPRIITAIDAIGSRALMDLTANGFTGISTGVSYDMWWNGGNRNVPVRHNIVGILTEAASVDLASPIFLGRSDLRAPRGLGEYAPSNRFPDPWPGGWWRLSDIINYEMGFAESLFGSVTREPQTWTGNAVAAAQNAMKAAEDSAPVAWIIPSDNRDPAAVRRLADVLLQTGVELHVSTGDIEADGRTYPAGSIVIQRDQPYANHVKDLFDVQRYPDGDPPYDVAGWTLPMLLGVRRVEVMNPLGEVELSMVETAEGAIDAFEGSDDKFANSDTWREMFVTDKEKLPRVGVYDPWTGSMDEGWMRWVLDDYGVPFVTVRNEQLRAGNVNDFVDVLIIPDISGRQLDDGRSPGTIPEKFARGLSPEGAIAIEEFVRVGGTLITFDSASDWAIDLFGLPLVDTTGEDNQFSCPGSVLRGIPTDRGVFTEGLPPSVPLFFSGSSAYREMTAKEREEADRNEADVRVLLKYAPQRLLLSGWIRKPEAIAGDAAWVRTDVGEGQIHLFGFRPQYRGWSQSTFGLVFRAMLFEQSEEE